MSTVTESRMIAAEERLTDHDVAIQGLAGAINAVREDIKVMDAKIQNQFKAMDARMDSMERNMDSMERNQVTMLTMLAQITQHLGIDEKASPETA